MVAWFGALTSIVTSTISTKALSLITNWAGSQSRAAKASNVNFKGEKYVKHEQTFRGKLDVQLLTGFPPPKCSGCSYSDPSGGAAVIAGMLRSVCRAFFVSERHNNSAAQSVQYSICIVHSPCQINK